LSFFPTSRKKFVRTKNIFNILTAERKFFGVKIGDKKIKTPVTAMCDAGIFGSQNLV
jgi:hypothetical protein